MTPRYATEELALMMPTSLATYFNPNSDRNGGYEFSDSFNSNYFAVDARDAKAPGLFARIGAWLRRRAAMDELAGLTDHELADIGLSRGDLAMAFDPNFVAQHNAERFGGQKQNGRIQLA